MRIALHYHKKGPLKYLSHLDVQRLWQRIFHIAGLEPEQTQGFNPHPKMRFALPLATGYYSEAEVLEIYLTNEASPKDIQAKLNSLLPRGMSVYAAAVLESGVPKVTALVTGAGYRVELANPVKADLSLLSERPTLFVNGKEINLLQAVLGLKDEGRSLNIAVRVQEQRAVRPEQLVGHLFGPDLVQNITRRHLFADHASYQMPPGLTLLASTADYVDANS